VKIASVAEIKSQLSAFLKASEDGPILVTRNGKPVAVIVGVQDEDEIERLLMAYSPRLQAILEASRKQIRAGEVLSHEEFWKEVKTSRGAQRRKAGPTKEHKRPATRESRR
jgi:prevent-host-death family protein